MLTQFVNRFTCGDCLEVLAQFPADCIPLVVTSPPFNMNDPARPVGQGTIWKASRLSAGYSGYADDLPRADYIRWQQQVLAELLRVLTPAGAIFYNHKPRIQEGRLITPAEIVEGLPVRQVIIWHRLSMLNMNPTAFASCHEYIYLITGPGWRLNEATAGEAVGWGDVWSIPPEQGSAHPCPFPQLIPERAIYATGADLVLDPFMGSGTTAAAAQRLGIQFIGIDQSEEYCQMARRRLAEDGPSLGL